MLQQPSQIMRSTIVRPLRSGIKKGWLLDDDKHMYRRHGDYKLGNIKPFTKLNLFKHKFPISCSENLNYLKYYS
jgi:hypothetical protein